MFYTFSLMLFLNFLKELLFLVHVMMKKLMLNLNLMN